MAQHIEPFDGGFVDARSASMLQPGELTECTSLRYRPGSPSLFGAPDRNRFDQSGAPAQGVRGITLANFDSGTDYIFTVHANGDVYKGTHAGAWSSVATSRSAITQATFVQYQNTYYVLDGVNRNLVIPSTLTSRSHGLAPQTQKPGLAIVSGTWPLGEAGIDLYYEYWATEIVKDANGDLIIESDVDGETGVETTPALIDDVTDAVLITLSMTKINASATHWRIYRSVGKELYNDKAFPSGVSIGDVPIPAIPSTDPITFTDGIASASTSGSPTVISADVGWSGSGANVTTDDGNVTSGTCTTTKKHLILSFGTVTVNPPIVGLVVNVDAKQSSAAGGAALEVSISGDAGATWSNPRGVPLNSTLTVRPIGSSTSTWGYPLSASSFDTANFRVRLSCFTTVGSGGPTADVDFVNYSVYAAGAPPTTGVAFPSIPVQINGLVSSVGENGQPPIAQTGDIFQDSMVTNDVSNPSMIRYSVPGRVEAFPSIYFIDFETLDNDVVQNIATLGNRLIVGLNRQVWRVNYLPSEEDATFNRGVAIDIVDAQNGIIGPKAATTFMGAEGRPELAYMSYNGLRATDGFTSRSLCDDIDWANIVDSMLNPEKTILVNDPSNQELVLFYTRGVGTFNRSIIRFNYHPSHLKGNGQAKACGKAEWGDGTVGEIGGVVSGSIPVLQTSSFGTTQLFIGYTGGTFNGRVYWQGQYPFSSELPEIWALKTRNMYLTGFGNEYEVHRIYGACSSGLVVIDQEIDVLRTNALTQTNDLPSTPFGFPLGKVAIAMRGEATAIRHTGASEFNSRADFFIVDYEDMGGEDK